MNLRKHKNYKEIPNDPFLPCGLSKMKVEEYAGRVAAIAEFKTGSPLTGLVSRFNGRVRYLDLDEWEKENESIYVHGPLDFDIILSEYTSPLRDQFTIGHELGHYFLHSRQGKTPLIASRDQTDTRVEWEANWFSAALLMPAGEFKDYWQQHPSASKAAGRFAVSESAAQVRANVLNLDG